MSKVLILGSSGLLGNAMYKYFSLQNDLDVYGTVCGHTSQLTNEKTIKLNVFDYSEILSVLSRVKPDWVINCIVNTRSDPSNLPKYFFVNSIFPQLIDYYSARSNYRFIHFSSNGVFGGSGDGLYSEGDALDAKDIYGVSKVLSENIKGTIIRTSIIGHSIDGKTGLLDWFLNNEQKKVLGHGAVYWNGITTLALAKIVEKIIKYNIIFSNNVIQLASDKKSKYELLNIFKDIYRNGVTIVNDNECVEDKTLTPSHEQLIFSDLITPIDEQLKELKLFYEIFESE